MDETGTDFSQSNIAGPAIGQESGLSGEETVGLISRLLDSKLDKKFADFKRALEQKELSTNSQIKKLKTEAKASNSFQFKGNKLQFEFNSSLLDSINIAFDHLHEGDLSGVNKELENVKASLNKRNKVIRFADKSPAGWAAVEEYESDELADDSEDEKKLRSAERRALSKIRLRKQSRSSGQTRKFQQDRDGSLGAGGSSNSSTSQPFRHQPFTQQSFRPYRSTRTPQPSDKCFACGQFGHWANSPFCPSYSGAYGNRALPATSTTTVNK